MFSHRPRQSIPQPYQNTASQQATVEVMKEIVEQLAGQRRDVLSAAVTWGDLLDLGLIKPEQVPQKLG